MSEKRSIPECTFFSEQFICCLKSFSHEYEGSLENIRRHFSEVTNVCNYLEKDFLDIDKNDAICYLKHLHQDSLSYNTIRNKNSRLSCLSSYIELHQNSLIPGIIFFPAFSHELFKAIIGGWVNAEQDKNSLIGRKFGLLTVKSYEINDKDGRTLCYCQCNCGGFRVVDEYSLLNSAVTHCGNNKIHRPPENLQSQKFGFLQVLNRDETSSGRVKWNCRCGLCGKIVSVFARNLKNGNTITCGCGRSYKGGILQEMLEEPEKYCIYWK